MTKPTPKLNKTGKKIRQRLHHKSLMHKKHTTKAWDSCFCCATLFPMFFCDQQRQQKVAIAKKTEPFFLGGVKSYTTKKGGSTNKPWIFWDPYKKSTRICFWDLDAFFFSWLTGSLLAPVPAGPAGDVSVSIVLPSASSRSEVNSQAKPGIWRGETAGFIRSFRYLGWWFIRGVEPIEV